MDKVILLFNRDLRVCDHPALAEAAKAGQVIPLFVFDDTIFDGSASVNRTAFLLECLGDLDRSLQERGSGLVVRQGDVVQETIRLAEELGAEAVYASEDVSAKAQSRQAVLARTLLDAGRQLKLFPGITVVPPGDLSPEAKQAFSVFTPYWHRWRQAPRRPMEMAPVKLPLPPGIAKGLLPVLDLLVKGRPSHHLAQGGESVARDLLGHWLEYDLSQYPENHNALAEDKTSRLSPYLHFGCLSPLEVESVASGKRGAEEFVRQLCWRDFFHQLLDDQPRTAHQDMRDTGVSWRTDDNALQAWKRGQTGYPIVDAGMRQLAAEGWMHNRARLITASFLSRDLKIDWREGAAHFMDLLIDGDVANNSGNWQWVAGTGANRQANRVMNPLRQAERFDRDGDYVRRYVPELAGIADKSVHQPWKLADSPDYPAPIIDPRGNR